MSELFDYNRGSLGRRIWKSKHLYLYILPTLLLLVTFSYYPALSALFHAFYTWTPFGDSNYVGVTNFRSLYTDLFTPRPAVASAAGVWAWIQAAGWGGAALLTLFFVSVEAVREESRRVFQALGALAILVAVGVGIFAPFLEYREIGRQQAYARGQLALLEAGELPANITPEPPRPDFTLAGYRADHPLSLPIAAGTLVFGVAMLLAASRVRNWALYRGLGLLALALGVTLVVLSLVTGMTRASAELREAGLLQDFLVGHVSLLALAGLQVLAYVRWSATRRRLWWRLLAVATVAAIFFGIGLVIHTSQGNPAASDGILRASTWNLVRVMAFGLTIGLFMPLLIAEILFHLTSDRWKYIYRVAFIIPMVVPGIVGLLMWQFIYDASPEWGILNRLIRALNGPALQVTVLGMLYALALYLLVMALFSRKRRGLRGGWATVAIGIALALPVALAVGYAGHRAFGGGDSAGSFVGNVTGIAPAVRWLHLTPRPWLGDPKIALYSLMMMGFPWIGTVSMLIFYAGLQAIPESVLESAKLDGATGLRRFFTIDFPMILGQFKLLLILGIIGGIQGFQTSLILTWGGPGSSTEMPGLRMFKEAFNYGKLGYGTTIGVAMFLIILAVTYVNMKYIRPAAEEDAR